MVLFYGEMVARLLLACLLGGIIGIERQNLNRPAGFRTHILVCVGSALVMVTSEFVFKKYTGVSNVDITRLGAQVISGIGFLGAGTIIRDGFNVKGLTTAASLWAVSCVGIAAGIGFYLGAIATTAMIYITLILLLKFELLHKDKSNLRVLTIQSLNITGQIAAICTVFDRSGVFVKSIEFENDLEDKYLHIRCLIKLPESNSKVGILNELSLIQGVQRVSEE